MKEYFVHISPFVENTLPLKIDYVGECFCDESFYFSRKNSDVNSFEYIISGEGNFNIGKKSYQPKAGDIFFYNKNSNHEYYCNSDDAWHKYCIAFSGNLSEELIKSYICDDVYLFKNTDTKAEFEKIYKIANNNLLDYNLRNSLIIPEIVKIFVAIANRSNNLPLDTADKIKNLIDMHISEKYTVEQISVELNYTSNHIINKFKEKFNQTPHQYLLNKRIELAKEYLLSSQYSVKEIAYFSGFSDCQYFSACFKKITGSTPAQYRKKFT